MHQFKPLNVKVISLKVKELMVFICILEKQMSFWVLLRYQHLFVMMSLKIQM